MKKSIKIIFTMAILSISIGLFAQTPPPPNNGNGTPGGSNTPVGGGAPIGSGLMILAMLGAGYGAKKVYSLKKRNLVD